MRRGKTRTLDCMIKLASEQFDALDTEAAELLAKRGFVVVKKERNGPFGAHSSQYERGKERITLAYDERDNSVVLMHLKDTSASLNTADVLLSLALRRKFFSDLPHFKAQIREHIHAI